MSDKTERLTSNVAKGNRFLDPRTLRAALEFGNA